MIPTQVISDLLKKHLEGNISPAETVVLQQWIAEDANHQRIFNEICSQADVQADLTLWLALQLEDDKQWLANFKAQTLAKLNIPNEKPARANSLFRTWWLPATAIAAAIILFFIFYNPQTPAIQNTELLASEVSPGTNKASLTLSNGQQIDLRQDKGGLVMDKNLRYSDGSSVMPNTANQQEPLTATIVVPKGGKYQVQLNDGSKIWLNSQSTLRYPLAFPADKREVSLEGEAYFEVAKLHHKKHKTPFFVWSKGQKIEVTGTQFNVSAYPEDKHTLTTLVEGSVKIYVGSKQLELQPNQQAQATADGISKKQVDIQSFVAWRHNKFIFNETELREVILHLSRWYAIDVQYASKQPLTYFYGEIDRNKPLSEVLKLLSKSGVKFKVKEGSADTKTLIIL